MSLLAFLAVVALAAASGASFQPGDWYAALRKPPLTPPNWIFGPVWSLLYLGIAVSGWLVWRVRRRVTHEFVLWGAQLFANALWSFLFFGLHRPGAALIDLAVLLGLVIATALRFARLAPAAAWLLVPYAAWVAFAGYLNAGVWLLNR